MPPSISSSVLVRLVPVIFVMLWATGFVGAKYGMEDAEPFTFLGWRFLITIAFLLPFVAHIIFGKNRPLSQILHSLVVGCLVHGAYLGGVFWAISNGLPAGISSLVVALQPFMTAFVAWGLMGERLSLGKTACFLLALSGVFVVLFPEFDLAIAIPGVSLATLTSCLIGTAGISIGTVYQKKYVGSMNLLASTLIQFTGAAILMWILAFTFETRIIVWTPQLIGAMSWLVLVLSIGAVALLMYLIRTGNNASVASLFFLVPVVAMFMAWVLFDEKLVAMQLLGSGIVVASVAVATRIK